MAWLMANPEGSRFELVNSNAEDLSFLAPSTVDLVIAAQAAHWFDYSKLWPELDRVLRPSGTVAFWVYSEFRLPAYPSLTPLITDYAQGTDPATSLGPHWQRPGRTILENHLLDVPEPSWGKTDRVFFTGRQPLRFYPSCCIIGFRISLPGPSFPAPGHPTHQDNMGRLIDLLPLVELAAHVSGTW